MDARQVVRYAGATREAAVDHARRDAAEAAAAGFRTDRAPRWDVTRRRPTLVASYRYAPRLIVERRVVALVPFVADRVALDAGEMALAGCVLEEQRAVRNIEVGPLSPTAVTLAYRFDPGLAGPPVMPIPPRTGDPEDAWLPVRHLLRAVRVPAGPSLRQRASTARRVLLTVLGAPRAAIDHGEASRRG